MKHINIFLILVCFTIPSIYCSVNAPLLLDKGEKAVKSPKNNMADDHRFKRVLIPTFNSAANKLWSENISTRREIWRDHVYRETSKVSGKKIAAQFAMQFQGDLKDKFKDLFKKEYAKVFPADPNPVGLDELADKHGNGAYNFNALFLFFIGRNVVDSIALAQSKKHRCYFRQVCDCEYE